MSFPKQRTHPGEFPLTQVRRMVHFTKAGLRLARRAPILAGVLAAGSSCTPAATPRAPLTPAEIPAVESRLARDPGAVDARLQLADAYRRSGRADTAVSVLQPVLATEPAAALALALVREGQGQYAEARRLYEDYLQRGSDAQVRRQVRDRLELLGRLELQEAAKYALSRERQLASTPPTPNTIGIFPFLVSTQDPQLRPLGTALAELLTTDLAQTSRLRVVERAQVQALLDELKLAQSGRVDTATASRSGRLMGAGRIVQGRVEGGATTLSLQAAVLHVPRAGAAANPLREQDALPRLFEAEKRLALGIYERLGVQLTDAERQRVLQLQTANVQALIALGFGLEAQDAGRHAEAAQHFARAVQLDPRFRLANRKLEQAEAQARASTFAPADLPQLGFAEYDTNRWADDFRRLDDAVPDPSIRDPFDEANRNEGTTRRATISIIIRPPGGQP
jgi:thioredoxin-like negative regulator of GroEL